MFLKIRTYRDDELYVILREVYKASEDARGSLDLESIANQNNIANSVWALSLLSFRLRYLCESILSCADCYSACIMYRALIEHAFKHTYIFVSCSKAGDKTGTGYVSSEHMSHEMLMGLLKGRWPDNRQSEATLSKPREFKDFKKRVGAIHDQFTFDGMARYLLEMLDEYFGDEIKRALREMIVNYSTLSSYVHAGPMAVLNPEEKPKKSIDRNSILWTMIAHSHTIELLSFYPSEHQDALKMCSSLIHDKIDKAMAIYNARILQDRGDDNRTEKDEGQKS